MPNQVRYYLYGYIIIGTCRFMHEILKFATISGFQKTPVVANFYLLIMIWWWQNIHAIQKEFWKQSPLYFWSVLQSHETCLKQLSVHAFTKCNTLARPVKQDGRVRSALLTCFCLIMFDLCVLMQMRNIPKTQGQPQLRHQARLPLLGRHVLCLGFA